MCIKLLTVIFTLTFNVKVKINILNKVCNSTLKKKQNNNKAFYIFNGRI